MLMLRFSLRERRSREFNSLRCLCGSAPPRLANLSIVINREDAETQRLCREHIRISFEACIFNDRSRFLFLDGRETAVTDLYVNSTTGLHITRAFYDSPALIKSYRITSGEHCQR